MSIFERTARIASKVWERFRKLHIAVQVLIILFIGLVILGGQTDTNDYGATASERQTAQEQGAEIDPEQMKQDQEEQKRAEEERKREEAEAEAQRIKDSNTFSEDDKIQLRDFTKENVLKILKAPSTAEFQGGFFDPLDGWSINFIQDNVATVDSVVDSQNSFGAMIRSEFRFTYCKSNNRYKVMMYSFEGQSSEQYETDCII